MNIHANLNSDDLIALGIKHQIKYSLYYIKKLGLKLSDKQANDLFTERCEIEKKYAYCDLPGKKLIRKIDDETQCMIQQLHITENCVLKRLLNQS